MIIFDPFSLLIKLVLLLGNNLLIITHVVSLLQNTITYYNILKSCNYRYLFKKIYFLVTRNFALEL